MNTENYVNYEPNIWNYEPIKKSSNCYQYMLNILDKDRILKCNNDLQNDKNKKNCGQIGLACPDDKCKKIKDQCERYKYIVENNKLNRHVYSLNNYNDKCSTGFYKGAIFFAPLKDKNDGFHFMRQDNNNLWSHKYSYGNATDKDLDNKIIIDPMTANLDYNYNPDKWWNFNKLCGTFCIQENDIDNKVLDIIPSMQSQSQSQ